MFPIGLGPIGTGVELVGVDMVDDSGCQMTIQNIICLKKSPSPPQGKFSYLKGVAHRPVEIYPHKGIGIRSAESYDDRL